MKNNKPNDKINIIVLLVLLLTAVFIVLKMIIKSDIINTVSIIYLIVSILALVYIRIKIPENRLTRVVIKTIIFLMSVIVILAMLFEGFLNFIVQIFGG